MAGRRGSVSRAVILPYKMGSRSAKALSTEVSRLLNLKVRRVRPNGRYRPRTRSLIVNYGSGAVPEFYRIHQCGIWLNSPNFCAIAGNKLRAFEAFKEAGLSCPEWSTSKSIAEAWIRDGGIAVCRTILNGHSGRGIVLADTVEKLVNAPLYVKYKKKRKEFRVHVFQGRVIDVAEKRKRRLESRDGFDGYVRNLANGWVFCRDNVIRPADLDTLAVGACSALHLDFGAVDIIWNERENKCYLLEVNTAPGLEGTTLINYSNAIYNWIKSQ